MKYIIRSLLGLTILAVLYSFSACSKQKFTSQTNCGAGCTGLNANGFGNYDYTYTTGTNKTDLLFVDDNSASMSPLQSDLGNRFPTLFNTLAGKDFRIGIINTDVVSSDSYPNPPRSTLDGLSYTQDGELIPFPDGSSILTPNSSNPEGQFAQTITQQVTVDCENWIQANCDPTYGCTNQAALDDHCPSEQTRAIYAADLAVANNSGGFFRGSDVPLNIVILSNADERAAGGMSNYPPLDEQDQPGNLLRDIQAKWPGKLVKIHSIIIEPGDSGCYNQQHQSNFLFGFYGNIYADASQMSGGTIGSICDTDYSANLQQIAESINTDDGSRRLNCIPDQSTLKVQLPAGLTNTYKVTNNSDGTAELTFSPALPGNTTVHVSYSCTD